MPKSLIILCIVILSLGAFGSYMLADDPDYFIGFELPVEGDEGIDHIGGKGHYCTDDYVVLTAYVKEGYIFEGWYDENGTLLESSTIYSFYAVNAPIYATTEKGYTVEVMRMDGSMSSFDRIVAKGESTTIEAVECGSSFLGWCTLDGELFSKDMELTFEPTSDITLVATTDSTFFEGDEKLEWSLSKDFSDDVAVTITDRYSRYFIEYVVGSTEGTLDVVPGFYKVVAKGTLKDGTEATETETYEISGDIHRRYCWMLGNSPQSIEWTVYAKDYADCKNSTADRHPDSEDRLVFVDTKSDSMKDLASTMLEKTRGMTDLERADYVLKFVQLIVDYEDDYTMSSAIEYWKYPIETLLQRGGDCEDSSILFCSLMQTMGYETALLIYDGYLYDEGHMAGSVALDYVKNGSYYTKNGLKYYYCETTSSLMSVGEGWDKYDEATVLPLGGENDIY